jgi:hypothetical protein
MAIDKLPRVLSRRVVIFADQINSARYVTVRVQEIDAVLLHNPSPARVSTKH